MMRKNRVFVGYSAELASLKEGEKGTEGAERATFHDAEATESVAWVVL